MFQYGRKKPIRFYASKDFKIQEDKWTANPDSLYYWCDQGDTYWRLVDDKVRAEALGRKRPVKQKEGLFDERNGTDGDSETGQGSRDQVRYDPADDPSIRRRRK